MSKFIKEEQLKVDNIVFNGKEMGTSIEKMPVLLTDKTDEDTQTIEELWKSMLYFCKNRVKDNEKYNGEYPIATRMVQMETLKALVEAIDEFHDKFKDKK